MPFTKSRTLGQAAEGAEPPETKGFRTLAAGTSSLSGFGIRDVGLEVWEMGPARNCKTTTKQTTTFSVNGGLTSMSSSPNLQLLCQMQTHSDAINAFCRWRSESLDWITHGELATTEVLEILDPFNGELATTEVLEILDPFNKYFSNLLNL